MSPSPHSEHVHLAPEDLLELALELSSGRAAPGASDAVHACPLCAQALAESARDLVLVREALARTPAIDARRAAELADGVLARTTREDLSVRGDWNEVARFLRGRWASSRALRLVAASLLLHLLALPVLAVVLVFRVRESEQLVLKIEFPTEDSFPAESAPGEPRRELVGEPEPELPRALPSPIEGWTRAERLERARLELPGRGAPTVAPGGADALPAGSPAKNVHVLLAARSRALSQGRLDASLSEPAADATALEHALWAEILLDDWALEASADARLSQALQRLSDLPATSHDADLRLAKHALDRALSYGFEFEARARPARPLPALDRAWFQALEESTARTPALAASEAVVAWLAWGREHAR